MDMDKLSFPGALQGIISAELDHVLIVKLKVTLNEGDWFASPLFWDIAILGERGPSISG